MKKITPLERYRKDRQYPTAAELEAEIEVEAQPERRQFLRSLVAGAAAMGASLLLGDKAWARSGPGSKLPLPGRPPLPKPPQPIKKKPPRPKDNPTLPGVAPAPRPNPAGRKRPCRISDPVTVTLPAIFPFCDGKIGQITVTTTDARVAAKLRQPGEGHRLATIIKPVFALEKSCAWLDSRERRALVEIRLAGALTSAYEQALGSELQPLKVSLAVHTGNKDRPPLPGLPVRPSRSRGCASCSTSASAQDALLPTGLAALALLIAKIRGR